MPRERTHQTHEDLAPEAPSPVVLADSASVVSGGDGRNRSSSIDHRPDRRCGTAVTYPGGKNGAGVYQRIINHMPPHDIYIEAFLGSGAVLRNKRAARHNVGIDLSQNALDLCRDLAGEDGEGFELIHGDALKLLPSLGSTLPDSPRNPLKSSQTLIYVDPPYMAETRKGGDLYAHELDDKAHKRLIGLLKGAACMVMISGYRAPLYDTELSHFHRIDYPAQTRRGMVTESLWMNFAAPVALHDYRHLGADYRERERIRRKKARWAKKFAQMNRTERLAIMDVLTREIAAPQSKIRNDFKPKLERPTQCPTTQ